MNVQEAVQVLLDASGANTVIAHVHTEGKHEWEFFRDDLYGMLHDYGHGTADEFAAACAEFKGEQ